MYVYVNNVGTIVCAFDDLVEEPGLTSYLVTGYTCEEVLGRKYSDISIPYVPTKTKHSLVNEIVVTVTSGKSFDGDEKSQDRILRAINIAAISGQATTEWILADNSIAEVTLDELEEALVLAGQEMSRIWLT